MQFKGAPLPPSEKLPDSGFSSAASGESSPRDSSRPERSASSDVNDLGTGRSLQISRSNWDKVSCTDVLKLPYEFFYRQDNDGDTRLHAAIVLGYAEAACWLIDCAPHPCLLDVANDESLTCLHLAALAREARLVRRLLLAGADPDLRTAAGNTALHLACARGALDCVRALVRPPSSKERAWLASRVRSWRACNVNARNYNGESGLHVAASRGHADLVRELLAAGADASAREGLRGLGALHLAVEHRRREVVRLLAAERPGCLEGRTYAGQTARELAQGDRRILEELQPVTGGRPAPVRTRLLCLAT